MVKTLAALKSQAATDLLDNTTQLITPAKVRQMIVDFLDTFTPAYGAMSITSGAGIAKTLDVATAVAVPWENVSADTTAEYTCNTATGTISRAGQTAARVNLSLEVYVATGRLVTLALVNNGTPTAWRFTALGQGVSKPASVALTAVFRASSLSLQVMATADAAGTATTFKNGVVYVSNVPVIS